MFFSKSTPSSLLHKHSLLASALSCALACSFGCNSSTEDPEENNEEEKGENDKAEKGDDKDGGKKDEKGEKGEKDEKGEKGDDKKGDDKKDDKENPEPTSKEIEFKLEGDAIDEKNLRIVIHPEVADGEAQLKLGKSMVDEPAKFKDGIMKLTVPPVPKSSDLGEEEVTLLLTTIFVDEDKSGDYSKDDRIVASVLDTPIYARPGNPEGHEEWLHLDTAKGQMSPIKKPLSIVRLDDNTEIDALTYNPKTENIAKDIGVIATISLDEMRDFSKNFQDDPRVLNTPVDREGERFDIEVKGTPDKARQSDKLPDYLPKFGNASVSFLGGFKGDKEVTKDSSYVGMGCVRMGAEDEEEPVYMVVANLWVEPTKNWVSGPRAAFDAITLDYRPGWNAVGIQTGFDGSSLAAPLFEEDFEVIRFDEICELKVKELFSRD